MANIVIIDDDKTITDVITKYLLSLEHKVISFNSSIKGLNYLKTENADILFIDIFMPEKDGYEIIEQIRKANKKIKVICSSAGVGPFTNEHALNISKVLGADSVLPKPFELSRLKDTINDLL